MNEQTKNKHFTTARILRNLIRILQVLISLFLPLTVGLPLGVHPAFAQSTTGSISGHLTDSSSNMPIGQYEVRVKPIGGGDFIVGYTNNTGDYTIVGIPYGQYILQSGRVANWCQTGWPASGPCQYARKYYNGTPQGTPAGDQALPITVDATNNPIGIDLYLDPGITLSGQVTDLQGNPLPNIVVVAGSIYYWIPTCTDVEGNYIIGGLLAAPAENNTMAGGNSPWCSGRALYKFGPSAQFTSDQVVNYALDPGGNLQVMVQDQQGNLINEAIVWTFDATTGNLIDELLPSMMFVPWPFPRLAAMEPGNAIIYIEAPSGYLSQYYNNAYTRSQAVPVTVNAGQGTSITVTLRPFSDIHIQWLPPLAMVSNGEIYQVKKGSTLPIMFCITDEVGNFFPNTNVAVVVHSPTQQGIFMVGDVKNNVKITGNGKQYYVNLYTKDFPWITTGQEYTIKVWLGAPQQGEYGSNWQLLGTKNFQVVGK